MLSALQLAQGVLVLGLVGSLVVYSCHWVKYSNEEVARRDARYRWVMHLALFALMVVLTKVALIGYYDMPVRMPYLGSWGYEQVPWSARLAIAVVPLFFALVGQMTFRLEKPVWLWGFIVLASVGSALSPDCMELWGWGSGWCLAILVLMTSLSPKM